MVDMFGEFLKLRGHAHISCPAVRFLFYFRAVFASTESITIRALADSDQVRYEA